MPISPDLLHYERAPSSLTMTMTNQAAMEIIAVRGIVRQHLPDFMIPSTHVPLARSPLNAKRRIDRPRLPAPEFPAPESARRYEAALSPAEELPEKSGPQER